MMQVSYNRGSETRRNVIPKKGMVLRSYFSKLKISTDNHELPQKNPNPPFLYKGKTISFIEAIREKISDKWNMIIGISLKITAMNPETVKSFLDCVKWLTEESTHFKFVSLDVKNIGDDEEDLYMKFGDEEIGTFSSLKFGMAEEDDIKATSLTVELPVYWKLPTAVEDHIEYNDGITKTEYVSIIIEPWRPCETLKILSNFDDCNVTYKRESELKGHESSVHQKTLEICTICMRKFTRKDNLTRHLKMKHGQSSKPSCAFSSKGLSRQSALQRHMSGCSKKPKVSRTYSRA